MAHLFIFAVIATMIAMLLYSLASVFLFRNNDTPPQEASLTDTGADNIEGGEMLDSGKSIGRLFLDMVFKYPGLVIARTVATDIRFLRVIGPIVATTAAFMATTYAYETYGAMGPAVYIPLAIMAVVSVYYSGNERNKQLALMTFWTAPITAHMVAGPASHYMWAIAGVNALFALGWVIETAKVVKNTYSKTPKESE